MALLSAVFAALTSILAKAGIEGVNSHLATALRTMVVVVMAWGMVFLTGAQEGIVRISVRSWIFLILSGLATGASRGFPAWRGGNPLRRASAPASRGQEQGPRGNQRAAGHGGGSADGGALTWGTWGSYGRHKAFLDLLEQTHPDIALEFISYTGGNSTGYSWIQMRADDIPDIFITSQILDPELAKERLADLSGYDFVNSFSTAILDQVSIDGGIYLLPVSNSVYGIYYNKTLMEEYGWELPTNFAELESLCGEIREAGLLPGVVGTQLTGGHTAGRSPWCPPRRPPPEHAPPGNPAPSSPPPGWSASWSWPG